MLNLRISRIDVMKDTIQTFQTLQYKNQKGEIVSIPKKVVEDAVRHTNRSTIRDTTSAFNLKTNSIMSNVLPVTKSGILLYNGDCLESAIIMKEQGYQPMVLNMASFKHPGGGYLNGAGAAEENYFRRSCLHLCLQTKMYPLSYSDAIVTKQCPVIKDTEANHYAYLDTYQLLDFVSIAAIRCSNSGEYYYEYDEDNYPWLSEKYATIMYSKIKMIFQLALLNGNDSLILSAFGCGAYGCPPWHVAKLFKQCIEHHNYDRYFKRIIFSMFDDTNAKRNWEYGNVYYFRKEFQIQTPITTKEDFLKQLRCVL